MTDYDYDVDNIDLESEMYLNDVREELEQEAEELEELNDEQQAFDENCVTTEEDLDYLDRKLRTEEVIEETKKINKLKNTAKCKKALDTELKTEEFKRPTYQFCYLNENYTGVVVHKLDDDNYVFSVSHENETSKKSLKKINLAKL